MRISSGTKTHSLEELKALLREESKKHTLSCDFLKCGIPLGGVTQVTGVGKTEWALRLCRSYPEIRVAWIEEIFSVYPFGFLQRGVDPQSVLFVDAGDQVGWAAQQVLQSQCFGLVVVYAENLDDKQVRRLQLAAERAAAALIWLSSGQTQAWAVHLKIDVSNPQEPRIVGRKFGA